MKVRELLNQLEGVDPDSQIVVDGYEAGYDDPVITYIRAYKKEEPIGIYSGKYDEDSTEIDQNGFSCVCIGR
jgi:hypothetical protein